MKKFILTFITLLSLSTWAEQRTIQGTHLNIDYQFSMSDEYQDVIGTWGEAKYNLEWDEYTKILIGQTAIEKEYFEYDDLNGKVYLTVRCGYGDLELIKGTAYHVKGTMCQEQIDQKFTTKKDALDYIVKRSVTELVTEFPDPARDEIAGFLIKTMVLE